MHKKIIIILTILTLAYSQEISLQKGWQLKAITQDINNPKNIFSNGCIDKTYTMKQNKWLDISNTSFLGKKSGILIKANKSCSITIKEEKQTKNILLLIADDLGIDASVCYGMRDEIKAPNIKALCSRGVVFENVWSNPVCSPTRATILTGKYGFRTGVGAQTTNKYAINSDEETIAKLLNKHTNYSSGVVGKWHLSAPKNGGNDNPSIMGFQHYSGLIKGSLKDYELWSKVVNGKEEISDIYSTTDTVNDAIKWVGEQKDNWFLWVAFNAPHIPFHLPPSTLHTYKDLSGSDEDIKQNPKNYYKATIEAMDTEIGRLIDSIDAQNTDIIYIADNGSPREVIGSNIPQPHSKGTLYQGGIQVPLIIAGPSVKNINTRVKSIVNISDLFATVLEMAKVDKKEIKAQDSISLMPYLQNKNQTNLREWTYSELFNTINQKDKKNEGKTIRDDKYKLIILSDKILFFDLQNDSNENKNLYSTSMSKEIKTRYEKLKNIIDTISK